MTNTAQPGEGGFGPPGPGHPGGGPAAYGYPGPSYGYPQQPPAGTPGPVHGGAFPPGAPAGAGMPTGGGMPAGAGMPLGGGVPLMTIGDIAVTADTVLTPAGPMPLKGAVWTATDMSRTEQSMPAYAVVLAIVFFLFCLLGLFFLLIKETRTTGHVQVTVNSGGRFHSTMVPVNSPFAVADVMNRVNHVRAMSF
ncbi:hypothetical protein GQS52_15210 [Streptomyces sp. SCUT-3]|uniref:hypothetical protein n=2 Tax=Streptomyces TaxID=1883 RepID=UPI0015FBD680|nr:hypothetical protein [Streptomyces sp. SCUT-3]QMV22905.1 hypothetical protein GQS52_15210 [Streptomyces sp. SCUT-3]